jgi:uncharacterized membrane protein
MWANLHQKKLYASLLLLSTLLFIIALGGGFFNQAGFWFDHWQHKAFNGLCHQDPQRSFWLNGTPMAVCSRCFGIYSGFLATWILFPILSDLLKLINGYKRWLLAGVLVINIIDVIGNFIGLWQNTQLSRFGMGSLIGLTAVLIIGYEFLKTTQLNMKGIYYGTD